ncbi:MAG TPA: polysaccharide biosynthesis/export family protein [Tepidisphaeraceae bacterium]|jgi:polysaccharide export outer membrane protein
MKHQAENPRFALPRPAIYRGVVLALFALTGGCIQERQSDPIAEGPAGIFRPAAERDVAATEYRVAPPDKLLIRAPGVKELDQFTTTIRPDGMISLNLLGELYVAGKTPREIGDLLRTAGARYYNNLDVQVDVAEYNSKFYEVFGVACREPGRKPFTGRNTVVSALAAAGFNDRAWPQQVHVSRPATADHPRATAVIDMTRIYLDGDTRQNYLLDEGDIIYVPPSPLDVWDQKTRQLFGPLSAGAGTAGAVQSVAGPTR